MAAYHLTRISNFVHVTWVLPTVLAQLSLFVVVFTPLYAAKTLPLMVLLLSISLTNGVAAKENMECTAKLRQPLSRCLLNVLLISARLSNPQSLNLYACCGDDPINRTDPSGLFSGWLKNIISRVFHAPVHAVVTFVFYSWVHPLSGGRGSPIRSGAALVAVMARCHRRNVSSEGTRRVCMI